MRKVIIISTGKGRKALYYYFKRASSPLILAGYGIEQAGAEDYLFKLATKLGVPVITTPRLKVFSRKTIHFH